MHNAICQFYIDCIRAVYNQKTRHLRANYEKNSINWQAVERTIRFHKIAPLTARALTLTDVPKSEANAFLFDLVNYQTLINLKYVVETCRLLKLFKEHNLDVLPYKGNLFIHDIYDNVQLREAGDIDFLFHPKCINEGIDLLIKEGYNLHLSNGRAPIGEQRDIITNVLNSHGLYELSMNKDEFRLDIHWGLHYTFLPYTVDFQSFFDKALVRKFYGIECKMPDIETMYWMLVVHHGGKECWLRLKHLVDLLFFLRKYGNQLDWSSILIKAKDYKLLNISLLGFFFVEKYFSIVLPEAVQSELKYGTFDMVERIEKYRNKADIWLKVVPALTYQYILMNMQDNGFSKRNYITKFLKQSALDNPLGRKRFVTFPDRYVALNLLYKTVSYLVRRLF